MTFTAWRNASVLVLLLAWTPAAEGQAPPPPLAIDQVVARFLERNLAVEAARHRVDIARAEQIAAQLRPNPTLTLSAENLKFAGPTPAGELYEVGATYSQPIERSDKRRHRREVADATVAVAEAELAETLGQRLLDVKRVFYETLLARHAVEHTLENRRAFESLVAVTEARFKEGAVAEGEVLKVRLERVRFDTTIAQAQLALRQSGIKLLDLLGETDFSGAGAVTGGLVLPAGGVPDVAELKASALQQRPSVRAAEHTVRLAERKRALERARSTADVSPFVGLRRVGENSTVLLGIAIPLPIMDRNEGGIARAAAEEKMARTDLELRRNRVLADVESAYQSWQSARERITAFESGLLGQADESQAIAFRAYQEGAIELLGYLEAQRTRAEIHRQYLQSVFDARTALLVLEQAVGRELSR
jgi:cobalt-zinc-cadmium efflux system outer membrane protein